MHHLNGRIADALDVPPIPEMEVDSDPWVAPHESALARDAGEGLRVSRAPQPPRAHPPRTRRARARPGERGGRLRRGVMGAAEVRAK